MSRMDAIVAVPFPTVPGGLNDPGCALTVASIYAWSCGTSWARSTATKLNQGQAASVVIENQLDSSRVLCSPDW